MNRPRAIAWPAGMYRSRLTLLSPVLQPLMTMTSATAGTIRFCSRAFCLEIPWSNILHALRESAPVRRRTVVGSQDMKSCCRFCPSRALRNTRKPLPGSKVTRRITFLTSRIGLFPLMWRSGTLQNAGRSRLVRMHNASSDFHYRRRKTDKSWRKWLVGMATLRLSRNTSLALADRRPSLTLSDISSCQQRLSIK